MRMAMLAACAAILAAACTPPAAAPTQEDLVARGEYLVINIAGCNDCHTPMTPNGPDMSKSLQGATLMFAPTIDMPWAPYAQQVAGLPANYTEDQFVHFIMTGERPSGIQPLPPMPPYRFNEADARAVAAYIKTLPRAPE